MKIADMCAQDTGGQSYRLARAVTEYTQHSSRSFRRSKDYLDYPADIELGKHDERWCRQYLAEADIVHVHNRYRYANGWYPINPDARWLIHQHGRQTHARRSGALKEADEARGALRCVSTLNLLDYADGDIDRWIPAPIRFDDYDAIKADYYIEHDGLWVAHSPTRRDYKGTELLQSIIAGMSDVELVLIEGTSHAECLRLKASCDVTFDQMHLCYGNSGLEGMAFGQPVLVGMPRNVQEAITSLAGHWPFVLVTSDASLGYFLAQLRASRDMREEYGGLAREYAEAFHDEQKVSEKVSGLYESLG